MRSFATQQTQYYYYAMSLSFFAIDKKILKEESIVSTALWSCRMFIDMCAGRFTSLRTTWSLFILFRHVLIFSHWKDSELDNE